MPAAERLIDWEAEPIFPDVVLIVILLPELSAVKSSDVCSIELAVKSISPVEDISLLRLKLSVEISMLPFCASIFCKLTIPGESIIISPCPSLVITAPSF